MISFKGAHFPKDILLMGVRWYVAYPLGYRHVEELMQERKVHPSSTTMRMGPYVGHSCDGQQDAGAASHSTHLEGRTRMARIPSSPHDHRGRVIAYTLPGGWQVLVGRTDADNDYLSFRVARPEDWWFHVRGMPGSHVILQGPPGADADRQTLTRAAAIAAYHSKARDPGVVAGSGTRARDVTKPRGATAGTVQIRHERVFKVRPARGDMAGEPAGDSA